jgi:hypothetical protein
MGDSSSGYDRVKAEQALNTLGSSGMKVDVLISTVRKSIGRVEAWTKNRYALPREW